MRTWFNRERPNRSKNPSGTGEHFEFGANWISFSKLVSEERIAHAVLGLQRLFPNDELRGKSFLDIGCGSGLSMLAAQRLGASRVVGIDIDERSIEAARRILSKFAPEANWQLECRSVFDLNPVTDTTFDVVYSWGVLHHTGDLWGALRKAIVMVSQEGHLAVALYRKTRLDKFWSWEKKLYSRLPALGQHAIRYWYILTYLLVKTASGDNAVRFLREYKSGRGMSWVHDVHDWLGGSPYQTASPEELADEFRTRSMYICRQFVRPFSLGLFGSGNDEWVAIKRIATTCKMTIS